MFDSVQDRGEIYLATVGEKTRSIPKDSKNKDYQRVLAWLQENDLTPYDSSISTESAKETVDRLAEQERLKYITPGSGQAGVYLQKAAEAKAALLEESPSSGDYPLLAASIGIDGANITAVATAVATIAGQWTAVAAHIENVRLTAKKDIEDGDDPETVLAALDWSLPE